MHSLRINSPLINSLKQLSFASHFHSVTFARQQNSLWKQLWLVPSWLYSLYSFRLIFQRILLSSVPLPSFFLFSSPSFFSTLFFPSFFFSLLRNISIMWRSHLFLPHSGQGPTLLLFGKHWS